MATITGHGLLWNLHASDVIKVVMGRLAGWQVKESLLSS